MKKLLLFLILAMFLLIMPSVFANVTNLTRVEYYLELAQSRDAIRASQWLAQTFNSTMNYNLTRIMLNITDVDGGTGLSVCLIPTVAGGSPDTNRNNILSCNRSIDTVAMGLTTTDGFRNYTIPTYQIQAGVTYAIMVNATGGGADNYGLMDDDTSPTYANGSMYYDAGNFGASWSLLGRDFIFELWANTTETAEVYTTPPEITFYNMTSEGGGCINWNTSKTNACVTSDTTPTVYITTNQTAYCRIGVSDLNYTALGSNRDCSGGGSTEHTCTLSSLDELTYEISYLYIGCQDTSGNENKTSTSGALSINITLDNYVGKAIELGVRNSLTGGYTVYTNQRVYARNSINTQSTGRFDKVVKKLNKIWAFNWISSTESYINMFNITPVFYALEFANNTNASITNQVELLINATK